MEEDIQIGDILDERYLLVRSLGVGGFGNVYLAQDILPEEHYVALKCLKISDDSRERVLIREMDFLARLSGAFPIPMWFGRAGWKKVRLEKPRFNFSVVKQNRGFQPYDRERA